MSSRFSIAAAAAGLAWLSASCGHRSDEVRSYREVAVPAPVASARDTAAGAAAPMAGAGDMGGAAVAASPATLRWTAPEGWQEQPGNAMRLATFLVGPERAECTIVGFPGDVGGLEANLRRWLGQLQAEASDEALARFARNPDSFASEGGLTCLLYDFAAILPAEAATSMLATVVPMEGQTFFVKLTGPRALLQQERERFAALCRSLRP